jgi:hypothetical protein
LVVRRIRTGVGDSGQRKSLRSSPRLADPVKEHNVIVYSIFVILVVVGIWALVDVIIRPHGCLIAVDCRRDNCQIDEGGPLGPGEVPPDITLSMEIEVTGLG